MKGGEGGRGGGKGRRGDKDRRERHRKGRKMVKINNEQKMIGFKQHGMPFLTVVKTNI